MQDRCSGVVVNTHDAWPHDGGQWRCILSILSQCKVLQLKRRGSQLIDFYQDLVLWVPAIMDTDCLHMGVSVRAQRSWVPTSLDWINLEISRYTYTFHVRDIVLQEHYRQKPPHKSASRCCSMLPNCCFFFDGGSLHLFIWCARCAPWGSKIIAFWHSYSD